MRDLALACLILLALSILAVSLVRAKDDRTIDDATVKASKWIVDDGGSSPSTTFPSRSRRNDEVEDTLEPLPTRHAKHRRRRRCKNRPTCIRNVKPFSTRSNETSSSEETSPSEENRHQVNVLQDPRAKNTTEAELEEDYDLPYNETSRKLEDEDPRKGKKNLNKDRNIPAGGNVSRFDVADAYEIEFEDAKSASWSAKDEIVEGNDDYADDIRTSAIYTAIDDQATLHESLSALLTKLFQSLRNASIADGGEDIFKELNFVDDMNEDPCQKWLNSKDKLEEVFLGGLGYLPACPCQYPSNIFYDDKIWDEKHRKHFRWRDVSGDSQRLDVYKPGAAYCVRSLLTQGSGSAAAQHCCYDRKRQLLTRGSGAGTPNFVSPEISPVLHERIDILPWRLCKGDFSRYNGVRPPNNDNACESNPDDDEYQRQIDDTKYY